MADETRFDKSITGRPLRQEEGALIRFLLAGLYSPEILDPILKDSRVTDLQDGGMGSIRFVGGGPSKFSNEMVEAQYRDRDDVLVSIAINSGDHGELFELDFWKVDFSPLKRYPNPSDVFSVSRNR